MTILDAHIYVGESLFGQSQSIQQILHSMDACGIDQGVLIPNRPSQYDLWPANLWTAAQAALQPQRFFWAARVDPWQKQTALSQLTSLHQEFGACGLLLHPWEEHFQVSDALVDPLVDYCQQNGLWVMVEAGYPLVSHPLDIAELANRHPQASIIATHGLQLDSAAFALTDAELAIARMPQPLHGNFGHVRPRKCREHRARPGRRAHHLRQPHPLAKPGAGAGTCALPEPGRKPAPSRPGRQPAEHDAASPDVTQTLVCGFARWFAYCSFAG